MPVGVLVAIVLLLTGVALYLALTLRRRNSQVQAALSAAERSHAKAAQWHAIIAGMPDGVMVLDAELRLVEWNDHFPDFVGVPAQVLVAGMHIADILRIQARAGEFGAVDVEDEVERRVAMIKAGISTGTIERTRPNGQTMELRRNPLAEGGFVTLYTDITIRRRAEDQLRHAQKTQAIGQLTSGVAHDFNNLLTVVIGNLEIAQTALQASNPIRAQSKIEAALGGAQRGATLTQRLLAFSRQQTLQPKPVDANRIVSDMSELIRHTIGAIALETVLAGALWQTIIDPNQLENVLLNLAINARDAMPSGGKITIETANANLDAAYCAAQDEVSPGQYVMVAVSDGGTGMSQDTLERAFEPFYTTKETGKGSGLGLSQVYGFIKQSNGHVKIYSELGSGTSVKLYLPRFLTAAAIEVEAEILPPEVPRAKNQELVLVVEDDPDVLIYSMETLKSLGYRVIAAKDAWSALRALDAHPDISLLFTDVELPDLNGPELVEEVRNRRPRLAVLYTTAYPAMAVAHRELLPNDVMTIGKPFVIAELAIAVREAIDRLAA